MHAQILDCLALASLFVTVTAGAAPPAYNKPTTKKAGTWTYYSTSTVTTTVPTVTWPYQAYDDRRITVTNSSTVTNTYTQYDLAVYDFTATITETNTCWHDHSQSFSSYHEHLNHDGSDPRQFHPNLV
ncbi:uncharacterized protein K489DRAFT_384866 [Dissoconium aciculare CBS 342.82]|uniref:Uncharacterized protein n=1 Tax=Dissoconium aciculare CBS 342.82 TaxID=1314786 RepID=A0A6J3LRH9_9PEZI|nr:uncharacterized protein K489DRAFT_384866 [Dissoconium aciculare CBS 342.82]KAF1818441.1 hypothetical protein K489DRAFT_384866 [Dissoconium aciculare CBS 342.82]